MLRSVGRLIVVAAPSCCGKTLFLAHLSSGAIPEIAEAIGMGDPADWRICDDVKWPQLPVEHVENLILAYAVPVFEVISGCRTDPAADARLEIISLAKEVKFVSLLTSSSTLTARLKARRRSNRQWLLRRPAKYFRASRLMNRLEPIYERAKEVRAAYEWWFKYAASIPNAGEWVVDANAPYKLKGWFKRYASERERGIWISNAEARYWLHDGADWSAVLDSLERDSPTTGEALGDV